MNYWRIKKYDIANGLGIRTSIWFTGCNFHCKDCFNEDLWSFDTGKPFDKTAENELFSLLADSHCKGLSVLGGEPLEQGEELIKLLKKVKDMYPPKDIWLWTGYELHEALKDTIKNEILSYCDFVVDGRFVHSLHGSHLYFRGSSNQNIYHRTDKGLEKIENPEIYFKR